MAQLEHWVSRAVGSAGLVVGERPFMQAIGIPGVQRDQHLLMNLMYDYYLNTGLYDELAKQAYAQTKWTRAMKGLRNPCYRLTEFYVDHVWDGRLDDVFEFEHGTGNVKRSIRQLWKWSNFANKKNLAVRQLSIMGNQFIKIEQPEDSDRVYFRFIDPRIVTDFETDERDFLTYIRMDQEIQDPDNPKKTLWEVEIWDKAEQTVAFWHVKAPDIPEEDLGDPLSEIPFRDFGIDFVPFVHIQFKDIGEQWGVGAYAILKDKIDEVNSAVTRLHQMVFRYGKAFLVLGGAGLDASGQSLPPPEIGGKIVEEDPFGFGDEDVIQAGGEVTVDFLVPNVAFDSLLNVAMSTLDEINRDAPELDYYRLGDQSHVDSSKSARIILGAAIKRVLGCRYTMELGLQRAHEMGLTVMAFKGLTPDGVEIGSFDKGDFEHSFKVREVIPLSDQEKADIDQAQGQAATYWQEVHIKPKVIAQRLGFKPSDVDQVAIDQAVELAKLAATKPAGPTGPANRPPAKPGGPGKAARRSPSSSRPTAVSGSSGRR